MPRAKAAAEQALSIDDRLAEAHASLAAIRFYHLEWDGVQDEFERAITLNPGYATALHWYALSLAALGKKQESITEIKLAQEIDPRSLIINANAGWCYYLAGDFDRAIEEEKNTLRLGPGFIVAHGYLGQAYLEKKLYDQAINEFRQALSLSPGNYAIKAELGSAYARAGKTDQAKEILQEFQHEGRGNYITAYDWAMLYAGMGNKQETVSWLEKAYQERSGRLANVAVHPQFAFLHGDTRFENLLARMNVPAELRHAATSGSLESPKTASKGKTLR